MRVLAVEDSPSVLGDDLPSSVKVEIHLLDTNDNSPVFIPSKFEVHEQEDDWEVEEVCELEVYIQLDLFKKR